MTKDEAMRMAIDVLEICNGAETVEGYVIYTDEEIEALRIALAQPEPEQQFKNLIDAIDYERNEKLRYFRLYNDVCETAQLRLRELSRLEAQMAAQPNQKPVAYGVLDEDGQIDWTCDYPFSNEPGWPNSAPLYTAPPQRKPIDDVTEAVTKTVIEVEKLLCEKLGKQWKASGISIETLVDELAAQPQRKPMTDEQIIVSTIYIDTKESGWVLRVARAIEAAHGIKD